MEPTELARRYGQSIWLDFISRRLIRSGDSKRPIEQDHLIRVASNPTLFEKAIDIGHDYDGDIHRICAAQPPLTALEVYER
jgi:transaldolase